MAKLKKKNAEQHTFLDAVPGKTRRGPKARIAPSTVRGRADNYRVCLETVWPKLWPALEQARTESEVHAALELAAPYHEYFLPHTASILSVLREKRFPRTRRGRIHFLADSVAGLSVVTPRRSRDICAAERAATKKQGKILRWEYYIECSCDYKGPSMKHACPVCEAEIIFPMTPGML